MSKIYEALENAHQEKRGLSGKSPDPLDKKSLSGIENIELEEEMIHLYQTINSLLHKTEKKIVQFIGSRKGEGTSTLVREFAKVCSSKLNISVLLLDANVQSSHTSLFNIRPESGLAEVVKDQKTVKEIIHQIGESSLHIGQITLNGDYITSIFNSPKLEGVLGELKQKFDLILIDSPSVDESTDIIALSQKVNGVVLVVEAENTRWPVANAVKERIENHGGNILGVILNKRKYYIPDFIYRRL